MEGSMKHLFPLSTTICYSCKSVGRQRPVTLIRCLLTQVPNLPDTKLPAEQALHNGIFILSPYPRIWGLPGKNNGNRFVFAGLPTGRPADNYLNEPHAYPTCNCQKGK